MLISDNNNNFLQDNYFIIKLHNNVIVGMKNGITDPMDNV